VTVVLDSGVWISALQFGGTPLAALERALTQDRVAICDQIEEEVREVLWKKFGWEVSRIEESFRTYLQDAIRVAVPGTLHGACRDAKDDMVVECAVNAGAKLIVSGDKDLLTLGRYRSVRVVTARDYVRGLQ
jgi:putative PIN family toxin of toxin-antitoxin system